MGSRYYQVGASLDCVLEPPRRVGLPTELPVRAAVLRSRTERVGGKETYFAALQFTEMNDSVNEILRDLLRQLSGVAHPG